MSPCCCWAEDILFCIYPVPVLRSLFTDLQEAHLGQHVKHSIFTPHSTLARFNQDTRNSCKFSSPLPQLPLNNPTHTHTHTGYRVVGWYGNAAALLPLFCRNFHENPEIFQSEWRNLSRSVATSRHYRCTRGPGCTELRCCPINISILINRERTRNERPSRGELETGLLKNFLPR